MLLQRLPKCGHRDSVTGYAVTRKGVFSLATGDESRELDVGIGLPKKIPKPAEKNHVVWGPLASFLRIDMFFFFTCSGVVLLNPAILSSSFT
jgi:hypothetical protein